MYKRKTEHNLYTCYHQPNINMNININININISCTFIKQPICLLMPAVKKFLEFSRVFLQPEDRDGDIPTRYIQIISASLISIAPETSDSL